MFKIKSQYTPTNDQSKAINKITENYLNKNKYQVLLGVTGSGKTFTIANVIEKLQMPSLIISHNKTLAAQLYQEFRDYFPDNAISYFVSYYDYYQPEAYIPSTDTYIEKDADINEEIDKLRLLATSNILSRKDVIVIASVSCIYNLGSPTEYQKFIHIFNKGDKIIYSKIIEKLIELQYERVRFGLKRGTFRVIGNTVDILPAYSDEGLRIIMENFSIQNIQIFNPVDGKVYKNNIDNFVLYPSKHFIADTETYSHAIDMIKKDAKIQSKLFKDQNKLIEAERITQKVNYDMEMISGVGYVKGIENYSRYFDGRNPGDPPYSLINYFHQMYGNNWLLFIDESHITFPQIRGMYNGDLSRKKTLIQYGFRLPSCLDNRPLKFDEFMRLIPGFIAASATPSEYEISTSGKCVVEQLHRPTGILEPKIKVKPTNNQVKDIIQEIKKRVFSKNKSRCIINTLTKRMAEDLSEYISNEGIKTAYIHTDIETFKRTEILDKLRKGEYDCLVGINLLREGLDLPEVSLVAVLDADKEGFLRSKVSLIQIMGRASRNSKSLVILYADKITDSIKAAVSEIDRRRRFQLLENKKYGIIPKTIKKPYRNKLVEEKKENDKLDIIQIINERNVIESKTPYDKNNLIKRLTKEMKIASNNFDFELAIKIRDKIKILKT